MKRIKPIFVRLILLASGVVIGALLAEAGLRLLEPVRLADSRREKNLFCRFDPELGWAPTENVTAIHDTKDRHSGLVHQNRFGIRGSDDMQLARTSGKRRVLVLGDSYAWGFGVSQDQLFSAPEVCGTNVEIINLGVSGYGTDQEYLLYERIGTHFVVDEVVVALTPYNDVENNLNSKQYGYLKPYFTMERQDLILHTNHIRNNWARSGIDALRLHSRLWNRLGDLIQAFSRSRSRGTAQPAEISYREEGVSERDRRGVELTLAILRKLKDSVTAHHARFSVIFIPYKPHIERRLPANHPLVPQLSDGLAREGIAFRDPYFEFLDFSLAGGHPFNDPDNHFGPEGHALFAAFLAPAAAGTAHLSDRSGR